MYTLFELFTFFSFLSLLTQAYVHDSPVPLSSPTLLPHLKKRICQPFSHSFTLLPLSLLHQLSCLPLSYSITFIRPSPSFLPFANLLACPSPFPFLAFLCPSFHHRFLLLHVCMSSIPVSSLSFLPPSFPTPLDSPRFLPSSFLSPFILLTLMPSCLPFPCISLSSSLLPPEYRWCYHLSDSGLPFLRSSESLLWMRGEHGKL